MSLYAKLTPRLYKTNKNISGTRNQLRFLKKQQKKVSQGKKKYYHYCILLLLLEYTNVTMARRYAAGRPDEGSWAGRRSSCLH